MEFQRERVYTALNADELKAGDKVIVANSPYYLKKQVEEDDVTDEIMYIATDTNDKRFRVDRSGEFALAYLVERKENCTNCGEGKWDAEHQKIHCNPIMCGNGNVVFRNHEIEVCEYWKPKTEKHYRPFKDTDELIKVWREKSKQVHSEYSLTMPYIWVKEKQSTQKSLITAFRHDMIYSFDAFSLNQLFEDFEFLDGSVCGVEE